MRCSSRGTARGIRSRACPTSSIGITMGAKSRKRPSPEAVMGSSRIVGIALSAALAGLALAGCGKFYWGQPGATQEQWDRDNRGGAGGGAPRSTAAPYGIVYEGA